MCKAVNMDVVHVGPSLSTGHFVEEMIDAPTSHAVGSTQLCV